MSVGGAQRVLTREDLKRVNPKAFAYMENLFANRVPQALTAGSIQRREDARAGLDAMREAYLALSLEQRRERLYELTSFFLKRGLLTRDAKELDRADEAVSELLRILDPVRNQAAGPLKAIMEETGRVAMRLQQCIAESRQWLAAGCP
jgi:hypothetical protein